MYQLKQLSSEIAALSPENIERLALLLVVKHYNISQLLAIEIKTVDKILT